MEILGYNKIGTGTKNVVFLHELFGDCTNYETIIPFLDKENFSYFFVDLRGYGKSKNILGEYNLEEASNDIINLLSYLQIKNYTLVAHSMSTMIAQNIATLDNSLKQLILITPISYKGVKSTQKAKDNLLLQMKKDNEKIKEIVEQSSKRYNQTWKNYRINLAINCSNLEARLGYMSMYLNTNFEEDKKINLDIPIKIITGKYDFAVFAKDEVVKYFQEFKNIEILECEEAGHYVMIECPIFFASKIESWCNF